MNKIGIIGMGFVGKAVYHGFSLFYPTTGYDIDPKKSLDSFENVLNSEFIFVCLPTPESGNGEADLTFIHEFFEKVRNNRAPIFILKSTVPIGTTKLIEQSYNINIVHNPEFLSARTADKDFLTQNRVIIGGQNREAIERVGVLFRQRFSGVNIVNMKSNESELVKYFLNCYFANKITFFNEMRLLSDKIGLSWENIMEGVLSDGRIEKLHSDVPGHDGKFGFGGACFPKDTKALSKIFEKNNIKPLVLDSVIEQNKFVRNNINWGGSGIEKCLYEYVTQRIPKGAKMLELGAGLISTYVFSEYFDLYTIEQSDNWLNKYPANYIYAPISNETNWYSRGFLENTLPKEYELVFVDGPSGGGNRDGILKNLDLFNLNCIWIFHDTHRETERNLAQEFANKTNKSIKFFDGCDFWAVVE